jgi:hypothetical protein
MGTRHRPRAALLALTALAPLIVLGGGCDWRDFDTIQAHTPVLAVGAPSQFGAQDFGRTLLPISALPTGATGGRFVVSAAGAGALAIIDVDAKGQSSGQNVALPASALEQPLTALAEVPGTGQVLLGAPGAANVYLMTMAATPEVTLFDSQPLSDRFGLGVAAGALAGAAAPDLVVASGSDLRVYVDGAAGMPITATASPDCPMTMSPMLLPRDQLRRAVLVAPLTGGAGAQIVVGTPTVGDEGAVSVFDVDPTSGLATCAFAYRNVDARFGQALAIGDFNADGKPDLLVGSPPLHAFWIAGPLTAASPVLPLTLAPGAIDLGATVAALDVDGEPGDEAFVGDPEATVGGDLLAGEVRVVSGAALDTERPVLRRYAPAASDVFGIALGALPFCTSGCGTSTADTQTLLLAGSGSRALTFFLLAPGDPRTP